jgi:hypothetical protein
MLQTSMTTASRIEINRANAQHSTGPKTESGKQRSSQNALRSTEDIEAYQSHLKSFAEEYDPKAPLNPTWSKPWPTPPSASTA